MHAAAHQIGCTHGIWTPNEDFLIEINLEIDFLQATQAVKIQFVELDFSNLIFQKIQYRSTGGMTIKVTKPSTELSLGFGIRGCSQ